MDASLVDGSEASCLFFRHLLLPFIKKVDSRGDIQVYKSFIGLEIDFLLPHDISQRVGYRHVYSDYFLRTTSLTTFQHVIQKDIRDFVAALGTYRYL